MDNLSNSNPISLQRVVEIIGVEEIPFYQVDVRDKAGLEAVFAEYKFDACIHFAGLKAVGESVEKPLEYYDNNIAGTLVLVDVMRNHDCKNIIFSSSATVYCDPVEIPITENFLREFVLILMAELRVCLSRYLWMFIRQTINGMWLYSVISTLLVHIHLAE